MYGEKRPAARKTMNLDRADNKVGITCPVCGKTAMLKTRNTTKKYIEYKHTALLKGYTDGHCWNAGKRTETTYCHQPY